MIRGWQGMSVRVLVCAWACAWMLFASSSPVLAGPRQFLEQHCFQCHDTDTREGGLDLTGLAFDTASAESFATWVKVHDRIAAGEMPPKEEPRPPEAERTAVTRELAAVLVDAERRRLGSEPRTAIRRLTRVEYENTVRDLFGMPGIAVKEFLPPDGSAHGFDKNADALDISHVNMTAYMTAADHVLDAAIAVQPTAPAVQKQRMSLAGRVNAAAEGSLIGSCVLLQDKRPDPRYAVPGVFQHNGLGAHDRLLFPHAGTVGVLRQGEDFSPYIAQFVAIYPAKYRIRTSLWAFTWDKGEVKPARGTEVARLYTVHLTGDGGGTSHPSDLIGYFDAPSIGEQVHEITTWFNFNDLIGFGTETLLAQPNVIHAPGGPMGMTAPGIACDYVEVEGPLYESWPPPSHVRMFGDLPLVEFKAADHPGVQPPDRVRPRRIADHAADNKPDPVKGVWTVKSDRPLEDADRLLADFLPRAFRRPVADTVRQEYVAQVAARLEAGDCFESAMRWAYRLALCSPDFLYHVEQPEQSPGRIDDHALARRLSYFLWNSLPDERLRDLAAAGKLHEPRILTEEVERMLADERSRRFVEDFLGQWLKLRTIGMNDVDAGLYPEFQKYLQDSMVEETRAYFRELIDRDLDATHLVKSDFAMLNGRLALHYGIDGVDGSKIRRVSLPPESPRGAFLTQASLLKITANGTVTSPVLRGAFVMERLFGRPPEPPPPGVPGVEPDVRGATTIREQLALHRDNQACAGCHANFDPPGFALESFDVIGGERTRYRAVRDGEGEPAPRSTAFEKLGVNGGFKIGPAVDPSGELLDGRSFKDVREFQNLIAEDPNLLLENMARQFLVYSTSRDVAFVDRDAVGQIVARTAAKGGGVRTLIHEIISSDLFQNR
jgi:mono/diheme cytochrome c family protein